MRPGDVYFGVDTFKNLPDERVNRLRRVAQSVSPGVMHLIYGDGRQLPFRDRSIHEEICVNVFGDRDTRDPEALAAELGRVLHETGSLTVVETKSPSIMPIERLRGLLGDAGLIQMNVGHELGNLGGVSAYALPSGKLASGDRYAEDYIAIFIHGSWAQG